MSEPANREVPTEETSWLFPKLGYSALATCLRIIAFELLMVMAVAVSFTIAWHVFWWAAR
jgi:hypothetical protein